MKGANRKSKRATRALATQAVPLVSTTERGTARNSGRRGRPSRRAVLIAVVVVALAALLALGVRRGGDALSEARMAQMPAAELQKLAVRRPNDARVLQRYATALLNEGAANDAAGAFARLVQLDERSVSAQLGLAQSQSLLGNLSEAERAYKRAQELDPNGYEPHARLARLYYENGEPRSAVREMEAAARIRPNDAGTWYVLGHLYGDLLQSDRALDAFQRVTRSAPNQASGWQSLGRLQWHRGRLDESERSLKRALELHPGDARTLLWMGQVYLRKPDGPESRKAAEEMLRAATTEGPRAPAEAHLELARLLLRSDRVLDAEDSLRMAIRVDPQLDSAYLELGRLLTRTRRSAEGRKLLAQFEQLSARRRLIGTLEAAVRKNPKDPAALIRLARLYREYRNVPGAMNCYRKYLTLRPDDQQVVDEMIAFRKEALPAAPPMGGGTAPGGPEIFDEHEHGHEHEAGEDHPR